MQRILIGLMALATLTTASAAFANEAAPTASSDAIIQELLQGNERYVAETPILNHQTAERRAEVAKGQHPPAIVLACADSRVAPEVIFNQGLGDLFVVRVAGNLVNAEILGSIEYAAEHLGSTVVVVLGHERCGAVAATVKGGHAPGHIHALVEAIAPSVVKRGTEAERVEATSKANVLRQVKAIVKSKPILATMVKEGKLKVVGARYDLDDGKVTLY